MLSWIFCISSIQMIFSRKEVSSPRSKECNSAPSKVHDFQLRSFAKSRFNFLRRNFFKRRQIRQIFYAVCCGFHFQESLQANNTRINARRKWLKKSLIILAIKVERLVNKDIDWGGSVLVAV